MRALSLFAGIGGFDLAFRNAGFRGSTVAYENWEPAVAVFRSHFPQATLMGDVHTLKPEFMASQIVTAGFPCTDLSFSGRMVGITGKNSGLIVDVLRLLRFAHPEWVLLENVPNTLYLRRGEAMDVIDRLFRDDSYRVAWRVLDSQYFGVAQRRKRVFILASRVHQPERVLFRDFPGQTSDSLRAALGTPPQRQNVRAYGFSPGEGLKGVGWGLGVVPTIRSSGTAHYNNPATWWPEQPLQQRFHIPGVEALEHLQGFPDGWTKTAGEDGTRHRLAGNAVAVPVVTWIAQGILNYENLPPVDLSPGAPANSRWGTGGVAPAEAQVGGKVQAIRVPDWPLGRPLPFSREAERREQPLHEILKSHPWHPLGLKAARGFAQRMARSHLQYNPEFVRDVTAYVAAGGGGAP